MDTTGFRELARRFAETETDAEAHVLFNATFGLQPARHAHLAHVDEELIPSATSWLQAPPVKVPPQLRKTNREYLGTIGQVRDVEKLKMARQEQAVAEHEQRERPMTTRGPIRLSVLKQLDDDALKRLLDLIGRALSAKPDDAGVRRADDGRVEISLRDARGSATIETPSGTFEAPDFLIDVRRTGAR